MSLPSFSFPRISSDPPHAALHSQVQQIRIRYDLTLGSGVPYYDVLEGFERLEGERGGKSRERDGRKAVRRNRHQRENSARSEVSKDVEKNEVAERVCDGFLGEMLVVGSQSGEERPSSPRFELALPSFLSLPRQLCLLLVLLHSLSAALYTLPVLGSQYCRLQRTPLLWGALPRTRRLPSFSKTFNPRSSNAPPRPCLGSQTTS